MTIHIGPQALMVVGIVLGLALIGVMAGVIPFSLVFFFALVLICPLLMFVMMRDMHGGRDERS